MRVTVTAWLLAVLVLAGASRAQAQEYSHAGHAASPPSVTPPYIGPEISGAVLARVSSSSDYDDEHPFDAAYGLGFWYTPTAQYSFGARYDYIGLGGGESSNGTDYVDASYNAHTLWAAGRVHPYVGNGYSIFVGVGVGLVVMKQHAVGVRTTDVTEPAGQPFKCGGSSAPNVGFRASSGLSIDIGERLAFLGAVGATMLRGSSDIEDGCVPGVGSPISVGVGMGFAYHFAL